MFDGKKDVWKACGPPTQTGCLVGSMFPSKLKDELLPYAPDLAALPVGLTKLCGINGSWLDDDNVYMPGLLSLAQVLSLDSLLPVIFGFLSFTSHFTLKFKSLLREKDTCALLLLAYWYAKVCQFPHWWTTPRAAMEGQAICLFLVRKCSNEPDVLSLLQYPNVLFENYRHQQQYQ